MKWKLDRRTMWFLNVGSAFNSFIHQLTKFQPMEMVICRKFLDDSIVEGSLSNKTWRKVLRCFSRGISRLAVSVQEMNKLLGCCWKNREFGHFDFHLLTAGLLWVGVMHASSIHRFFIKLVWRFLEDSTNGRHCFNVIEQSFLPSKHARLFGLQEAFQSDNERQNEFMLNQSKGIFQRCAQSRHWESLTSKSYTHFTV